MRFINDNNTVDSDNDFKKIIAVVEEIPNFIFHLLSVSKVVYNNNYSSKYNFSVINDDICYIKNHEYLYKFGDETYGQLTDALIFIPSYLGFISIEELIEYFSIVINSLETKRYDKVLKHYKEKFEMLKLWPTYQDWYSHIYFRAIREYKEIIKNFGEICQRNYFVFKHDVWINEKKSLAEKAQLINLRLQELNIVRKWENITSYKFKCRCYYILLCSSLENGPNCNSLGYERNVFNYSSDLKSMIQLISHETGTHIMIDIIKKFSRSKEYNQSTIFRAFESLAYYYNKRIFENNLTYNSPRIDSNIFCMIYEKTANNYPGIKPLKLFSEGIRTYLKSIY